MNHRHVIQRLLSPFYALLLLFIAFGGALAQNNTGVIEGQVTLAGHDVLPEGLEAELLFLPNGQGPPVITPQPLDENGTFRFTGIDTSPQHRYLVRVAFEAEENYSELLAFTEGQSSLQVDLMLYEQTADTSSLSLPEVSYVLDVNSEGWIIAVLYRYANVTNRVVMNKSEPPARIPYIEGATGVQFAQDVRTENVVELPDGFAYPGPFVPGYTSLIFSYVVPYQEGEQALTLPLGAGTERFRVLVPQLGQQTESDTLQLVTTEEVPGGRLFDVYETPGPTSAGAFTLHFAGLPTAPAPAPGDAPQGARVMPVSPLEETPIWTPLVPVALVVAGLAVYLVTRREPDAAEQRVLLRERRDALVAEIAALDTRFEAGAIGEQTHLRQRAALKHELKEVLRVLTPTLAGD